VLSTPATRQFWALVISGLTEAVHLTLAENRALKIARLKVTETSTKNPASAPLTSLQSPINRTPFM